MKILACKPGVFLAALVLTFFAAGSRADIPQFTSRTWQTDEGLPHNSVQAIVQTHDGYLWLGTQDGLARFDGVRFTIFDSRNAPEIKGHSILALCETDDGTLWIGTDDGLAKLKDGKFSAVAWKNISVIRALLAGKDGSLWIGTANGLAHFQQNQLTFFTEKDGLVSPTIRSLYEDRDENVWIATGVGLNCFSNGVFKTFASDSGLLDASARAIRQDKNGVIWIGSNFGLSRLQDGQFTHLTKNDGLAEGFISTIFEDRDGLLWVGSYAGLNLMVDGKVIPETAGAEQLNDLVNAILQDREGNIWIGEKEGLTRLSPRRCTAYTKQVGLSHHSVVSVLEDRSGALWIGTWGGGLNRLQDGKLTFFGLTNGLINNLVLAIHQGRDGALWVGEDFDGGVHRFVGERPEAHFNRSNGLNDPAIAALYEDTKTNLWIGTRTGLNRLSNGQLSRFTTSDGLAGNMIRAFCEDRGRNLWIGTDTGLSRWSGEKFSSFEKLKDEPVFSLYEDAEQNLWIGTRDGLHRLKNEKLATFTANEGLFHETIFEILEDDFGSLWMSCPKGVFRVSKKELEDLASKKIKGVTSVVYGKSDGLPSPDCKGVAKPAGWKTKDGRLWFPTSKGLVAIDPKIRVEQKLPVYIEEFSVDGAPQDFAKKCKFIAGKQSFIFHYTGLSFFAPEKVRFKYKLEGFDQDWIDAGSRREALYTHISSGDYTFRVMAANGDGIWNETEASLKFQVVPPFWMTWWFIGFAGVTGISAMGGAVHFVSVKKLQRKLKVLEQQNTIEKERIRISRDMHDDLGGSLTQIALLSDTARKELASPQTADGHLRRIAESARQSVHALEEIVWAVHPDNDTLDHLATYLAQFAEEFFRHTPVRCRVDLPATIPPHPLSSETRHHLFLIVKETLNNSLKYAGASEIWLRLNCDATAFTILVEDNGRGFDVEKNAAIGNGLRNLKKRALDIGARLNLESTPGHGTKMTVTMKIKS